MNFFFTAYFILLSLFCGVALAGATLLSSAQSGVVFDNVTSKYWLTDLNSFSDMSYTEQIQEIDGRNDLGLNWHMASGVELRDLWLGNGPTFLDMFLGTGLLYSGRIDSLSNWANGGDWANPWGDSYTNGIDPAHMVGMFGWDGFMLAGNSGFNFFAYDDLSHHSLGAWVVADGPVPVPEPATFFLLTLGILSFRMKRKSFKLFICRIR